MTINVYNCRFFTSIFRARIFECDPLDRAQSFFFFLLAQNENNLFIICRFSITSKITATRGISEHERARQRLKNSSTFVPCITFFFSALPLVYGNLFDFTKPRKSQYRVEGDIRKNTAAFTLNYFFLAFLLRFPFAKMIYNHSYL